LISVEVKTVHEIFKVLGDSLVGFDKGNKIFHASSRSGWGSDIVVIQGFPGSFISFLFFSLKLDKLRGGIGWIIVCTFDIAKSTSKTNKQNETKSS